jgi:hypothetical protein
MNTAAPQSQYASFFNKFLDGICGDEVARGSGREGGADGEQDGETVDDGVAAVAGKAEDACGEGVWDGLGEQKGAVADRAGEETEASLGDGSGHPVNSIGTFVLPDGPPARRAVAS